MEKNIKIKTGEGWMEYARKHPEASRFDNYCRPGDYIDEELYYNFRNVLPPELVTDVALQVGKASSMKKDWKTGKYYPTYPTFLCAGFDKGRKIWQYMGNCFKGEFFLDMDVYKEYPGITSFLQATYRVPGTLYNDRPPVICKDGFRMSVKASSNHYCNCSPRMDLENGTYAKCEVDFPSETEELLLPYAGSRKWPPTKTIYPYVPIQVIDQIVEKHGGYFNAGKGEGNEKDKN